MIITDDGFSDSESNPETLKQNKFVRTTKEQFKKLISYMETHDDFDKGKARIAQQVAWDSFVIELNDIGPPYRTSEDWRIVWIGKSKACRLFESDKSTNWSEPNDHIPTTSKTVDGDAIQSNNFFLQCNESAFILTNVDFAFLAGHSESESQKARIFCVDDDTKTFVVKFCKSCTF